MIVLYTPAAKAGLSRIPDEFRQRVSDRADRLGANPRPRGWALLHSGPPPVCKVRQGAFRIVYTIQKGVVTIVDISDRREAYTLKGKHRR